jgi:hypothetical protein
LAVVVVVESGELENGDEIREGEVLRDAGGEKKETMDSHENGIVGGLFLDWLTVGKGRAKGISGLLNPREILMRLCLLGFEVPGCPPRFYLWTWEGAAGTGGSPHVSTLVACTVGIRDGYTQHKRAASLGRV